MRAQRMDAPRLVAAALAALIPVAGCPGQEAAAGGSEIPDHPGELVFPDLEFSPPEAAEHRRELPGGVPVYVVEDRELPLVDIEIIVRTGSYLDPPGECGLAHLVASQLRAGGAGDIPPDAFDEEVAFLAAEISSSAGHVEGRVSMNCLTKDLERVLDLFFRMLRQPRFDRERLRLEKSRLLQEIARRNDETRSIEMREWERLLRGDDFYTGARVTRETLENIEREDLVAFHRKHYHPEGFIFAVSGDVDSSGIEERLSRHLRDWPGEDLAVGAPAPPGPARSPRPGVYLVDKPDVNQGRVSMGHLSALRDVPEYHALFIMNQILGGGGFTSRITSRVRSDEGLAYSAGSRFEFGVWFPGDFRAYFQSKSESVVRAARMVHQELERIRAEAPSAEEVETAVNHAVGIFPRFFANSRIVATTFASDEFTGRDPRFWKAYDERMRAVGPPDVLDVAREHIDPDGLVVLIVGNVEEILEGAAEDDLEWLEGLAGEGGLERIPLPDPMTLEYPGD